MIYYHHVSLKNWNWIYTIKIKKDPNATYILCAMVIRYILKLFKVVWYYLIWTYDNMKLINLPSARWSIHIVPPPLNFEIGLVEQKDCLLTFIIFNGRYLWHKDAICEGFQNILSNFELVVIFGNFDSVKLKLSRASLWIVYETFRLV